MEVVEERSFLRAVARSHVVAAVDAEILQRLSVVATQHSAGQDLPHTELNHFAGYFLVRAKWTGVGHYHLIIERS